MSKTYILHRNDIILLDFEPCKGKEIGKYRPALVLSSAGYNEKCGLLICCPISTSIRGVMTEVTINNLKKPSVVAASLIYTFSWKERKAKFVTKATTGVFEDFLKRLLPLIGATEALLK